jgi:hypothetical protein
MKVCRSWDNKTDLMSGMMLHMFVGEYLGLDFIGFLLDFTIFSFRSIGYLFNGLARSMYRSSFVLAVGKRGTCVLECQIYVKI